MEEKRAKRKMISDKLNGMMMRDAGMKRKNDYPVAVSSSAKKNYIDYPSLYLNAEQAPDLKGYDVEDEVTLMIKGKITSHSLSEDANKKRETFDIQIKQIGCQVKKMS